MANNGVLFGRTLIQQRGELGGARAVFVKLQGVKNELVFPTFGGQLKNPFKGVAKIYAGDLFEFRTDEKGVNPELYILKTYKVKSVSGSTVTLYKDGFKHIPFVGDKLGVAPDEIGGEMTVATVTAVKTEANTWVLTVSGTISASDGDILVEADDSGNMLVKDINAVAPCDYDFVYNPAADEDDYEGARYHIAPALGGLMYIHKMSPLPECVLALNKCNINGWFKVEL